jgi:serine/threonine protein kinase
MRWKSCEGKLLAGTYPLSTLLRAENNQAWFATQYRQKPATILVAELAKEEADQRLANLEAASRIKHANLVSIERTGRSRLDSVGLIYAVMENTEEDLASVLRERALTTEETAEITESLVAALSVVHEQGLVHGAVRADNVLAAGETVKLRSDCISKLPVTAKADPESYAQDVGDLGALIFEALTQRQLTSPDEPAIRKLAVPFRAIVQSAVTGRWGLADISAALKKASMEPHHPIPTSSRQSVVKGTPTRMDSAKVRGNMEAQTAAVAVGRRKTGNVGVRIFAILAILAALAVAWFHFHGQPLSIAADPLTPVAPLQSQLGSSAVAAPQQQPTAPLPSDATRSAAAPPMSQSAPDAGERQALWRVVVYTYASENEAQRKVERLLQTHPELNPEVFTPTGLGPYLVTVGGRMTHEEAAAMRSQARDAGLPRDSYAQNYSH